MSSLKKYAIQFAITMISILLMLLLTTTLYYFNLITPITYNILKIITLLITLFINSFILGKKAKSKGYLEGIKSASIIIIIFLVITLLTNKSFEFKYLIYYAIILITSILGGMIGISKKKEL